MRAQPSLCAAQFRQLLHTHGLQPLHSQAASAMPTRTASGPRVRNPGHAGCVLNYHRSEEVVQVLHLERAQAARREVEERCADVMGVRGQQWTCSTALLDSKWTTAASDSHLANQALVSSFQLHDMRRTRSPPRKPYDTQHYHAFTRGDAPEGWRISTEAPSARELAARQAAADAKAAACSATHTARLKRSQSPSLMQREEAFATGRRQQKEAAAAQAAELLRRFGPDGAAAMQHILAMRKPDRTLTAPAVRIRASKADVDAVQQLPPLGLPDDAE